MENKLNEKDLKQVVGGAIYDEGLETNGQFSGFIDLDTLQNEEYFNKEYYFVSHPDKELQWFRAILVKTYNATIGCTYQMTHKIIVTDGGNYGFLSNEMGKELARYAKDYAVYTTKNY